MSMATNRAYLREERVSFEFKVAGWQHSKGVALRGQLLNNVETVTRDSKNAVRFGWQPETSNQKLEAYRRTNYNCQRCLTAPKSLAI
jgi:hypothetical protein